MCQGWLLLALGHADNKQEQYFPSPLLPHRPNSPHNQGNQESLVALPNCCSCVCEGHVLHAVVILVGNKTDLAEDRVVSVAEGQEFADR